MHGNEVQVVVFDAGVMTLVASNHVKVKQVALNLQSKGAVTIRRQITASAGLGHATRGAGRRATRTRQQSRDDLPG
jgi:hypothetical protein